MNDKMLQFIDVKIEDYEIIQTYFSKYGENSCQHSFVNMFTLQEKYGSKWCEKDGFLFTFRENISDSRIRTYLFPMGEGDVKKAVWEIIQDAREHGARVRFQTITEEKKNWLLNEFPHRFAIEEDRDYAEYLYLSKVQATLPGNKFCKKRSEANIFRRKFEDRMSEVLLSKEQIPEILSYAKQWLLESADADDEKALMLEYKEIEKQLQYFDELKISGLVIRIDGKIIGVVYGVPISDSCFDVTTEKGSREFRNVYRVLRQDISKLITGQYTYINLEEDVGVEGLRRAKLSYKPDILLKKYVAEEYENEVRNCE